MNILEIERFIRIIKQHWDYFLSLLSNISYQEINLTNVYNNKIIGPIRIGETNKLRVRLQKTTNIVACSNSIRSIFTPENTLFATGSIRNKYSCKQVP